MAFRFFSLRGYCRLLGFSLLALHVRGFLVSRTPICRTTSSGEPECEEVLSGILTLRNEEKFKVAATIKGDDGANGRDPSHQGVTITIDKSPVLFVYDLKYELDVFSDFTEKVHEYPATDETSDPRHFCLTQDVEKCNEGGEQQTPDGGPLGMIAGRCCWCSNTALFSGRVQGPRRGNMLCGTFDQLLRKTPWVTKYCPKIQGPWYSAMSFGPWRWDFTMKVTVEWFEPVDDDDPSVDGMFSPAARAAEYECLADVIKSSASNATELRRNQTASLAARQCRKARSAKAGTTRAEYILGLTTPEIYDEKAKLGLRITGSNPQTAALPPSLNNQFLFIPYHPVDHPIVKAANLSHGCGLDHLLPGSNSSDVPNPNCLSNAMLLPSSRVDLTGTKCDMVGTSVWVWGTAGNRNFCDAPPGACMGNQIGSLRREDDIRIAQGKVPRYRVGSHSLPGFVGSQPVFLSGDQLPIDLKNHTSNFFFGWTYPHEHITTLEINLPAERMIWLQSTAPGEIVDVKSDLGCAPLSSDPCVADVYVKNTGEITSRFAVHVPYCMDAMGGERSFDVKPLTPLGRIVATNRTRVFRFHVESVSSEPGYYSCKTVLIDGQGRRMDHSFFNVSFLPLEREYQGRQLPLWDPHVKVDMMDSTGGSISLGDFLGGMGGPMRGGGLYGRCNCSILNAFCIMAHFWECLARARGIIWSGVSCVGLAASVYVCGPSATFCLKVLGKRMVALRRRQQKYVSTEAMAVDKSPVCARPSEVNVSEPVTPASARGSEINEE